MKKDLIPLFSIILLVLLSSCKAELEELEDYNTKKYTLINQDSAIVEFPTLLHGNIGVMGYIFTNCPDICPITTNNMRRIQDSLKSINITNVKFLSISFDVETDKPSILKEFAEMRNLDLSNWQFLTGKKGTIDELMKKVGVVAFKGDSTVFEDGSRSIYYVHTDRIQLVDKNGMLRRNYIGSKLRMDEIMNDIQTLNEE